VLAAGSAEAAGPNSGATSALIQPDGKIVAAGWGETASWGAPGVIGLARYTPSGSLDRSFGSAGEVAAPAGAAGGIARQPDGKLVVAGSGGSGFVLVRYTSDGLLDTTFGTRGTTQTDFGPMSAQAAAVAIQADGKIVAAGPLGAAAGFAVARYNANGSLDTTFGKNGRVTTEVGGGGVAFALAIQPDGKIVVAGSVSGSSSFLRGLTPGDELAVARYNPDGTLDTTFGTGGVVASAFGLRAAQGSAVVLQRDGKIVVAGAGQATASTPPEVILARFAPDGSPDPGFGSNGVAATPVPTPGNCDGCGLYANAIALQADGKLVAAGQGCSIGCWFALERYNPNGSLDQTFGTAGRVTTYFGSIDSCSKQGGDFANAVELQPDGKIVAAGYSNFGRCSPDYDTFTLARYNPSGSLDASFGKAGKVKTSVAACDVPKLRGLSLSQARKAVTREHCALGKVSRVWSRTVKRGLVISQRPAPGGLLAPKAKVSLTVSRGRHTKPVRHGRRR
jgi:uncharacterized delta-60 repeat protein